MTEVDLFRSQQSVPRLDVRHLARRFGDVVANDGIDLHVGAGEVVGLLGENGAGKSTLLSILTGLTTPDSGEIRVDGAVVSFNGPADAIRSGIGTVFQHFALVPVFTVREQLRLSGGQVDAARTLLAGIDLDQRVSDLSVGERQRVEIARVLARQPRLLLLDEPTSTLTGDQVEQFITAIRRLRDQGVSVVFVTHKLPEALSISDRLVVMRRGKIVDEVMRSRSGSEEGGWGAGIDDRLLGAMFGPARPVVDADAIAGLAAVPAGSRISPPASGRVDGDTAPVLDVRRATTTTGYGRHRPVDITFSLGTGTTLAIVGIDGQGQRELAELLAGHLAGTGSIRVDGNELIAAGAAARQHLGVGYLTDDRTGEGSVPELAVSLNLLLKRQRQGEFQRLGVSRSGAIRAQGRRLVDQWGIAPPSPATAMGTLSGGNMQKVMLARELELNPRVLIANNPAHGLDLRTQRLVWDALAQVTAAGGAVVLLSPDISEALHHADEVAVIAAGRLSPTIPVTSTDHRTLSRLIVSGW